MMTWWHDNISVSFNFKIIDRMKIYAKYCNNYDSAEALYKQKIKKKEFESFINVSIFKIMVLSTKLNGKFTSLGYCFQIMIVWNPFKGPSQLHLCFHLHTIHFTWLCNINDFDAIRNGVGLLGFLNVPVGGFNTLENNYFYQQLWNVCYLKSNYIK